MSYDAVRDGYIAKLFKSEGMVAINKLMGVQVQDKADIAAFKEFSPANHEDDSAPKSSLEKNKPASEMDKQADGAKPPSFEMAEVWPSRSKDDRVAATPRAKVLAAEFGVDLKLAAEVATGRDGQVVAADVANVAGQVAVPPAEVAVAQGAYEDIPLTPMRKVIAERLSLSKRDIPHFTVSADCLMDNVMRF